MKIDILKELSENYALENNSSAITEMEHDLQNVLEHVEELQAAPSFPVEAVPVFEAAKEDGTKTLVVDAYDLARYMESCCETDPLTAIGNIKSDNLIPDGAKFAVLIDKKRLTSMCEAVETNPKSGLVNVGHATNMLQNLINKGIGIVTK